MPQFVIERDMPGVGQLGAEELKGASQTSCSVLRNLGPEIQWVHSYVTDDKIYCVYRAPDADMPATCGARRPSCQPHIRGKGDNRPDHGGVANIKGSVAMIRIRSAVVAAVIVLAGHSASAQPSSGGTHSIMTPSQIKWGPAPPSLPPGAQAAILYGDPGKDGMFVLRLRLPAGYKIPPHTHPKPEIVTVVSGAFHVGMGTNADPKRAIRLPPGSFFAFDPGMAHFAHVREATVVQLSSTGPWGITYANKADDPRSK